MIVNQNKGSSHKTNTTFLQILWITLSFIFSDFSLNPCLTALPPPPSHPIMKKLYKKSLLWEFLYLCWSICNCFFTHPMKYCSLQLFLYSSYKVLFITKHHQTFHQEDEYQAESFAAFQFPYARIPQVYQTKLFTGLLINNDIYFRYFHTMLTS